MEPDDLLCSRNARPEKALVGRAQWKINQPPSPEEIRSELGGATLNRSTARPIMIGSPRFSGKECLQYLECPHFYPPHGQRRQRRIPENYLGLMLSFCQNILLVLSCVARRLGSYMEPDNT
jgi:hypothetical protein